MLKKYLYKLKKKKLRENLPLVAPFEFDSSNVENFETNTHDSLTIDYFDNGQTQSSSQYIGKALQKKRIFIFQVSILLCLSVLISKSFYLQIVRGAEYSLAADNNRMHSDIIPATRGLIFDRNGQMLVKNLPNFTVSVIPSQLPDDEFEYTKKIQEIAELLEMEVYEIEQIINDIKKDNQYYYQPITLKENVEHEKALLLQLKSRDIKGLYVETFVNRKYLVENAYSLSHILGYTGKITAEELEKNNGVGYLFNDTIGKTGLEKYYELLLKGEHGKTLWEVNALGKEQKIVEKVDKKNGKNLSLTIDLELQKKLEEITLRNLEKKGKHKASIIALNPQNGEVLALVSLPAYDNNDFTGGISQEKYNTLIENEHNPLFARATSGEYPSGSTFKLIMSAAALQENIITARTTFLSTGGLRIGQWYFPDWKNGGHGITNVKKAISESVNTFYYIIGGGYENITGLGIQKIVEYAHQFGLAQKTGIDLPHEADGFLPSKEWKEAVKNERWYIGDTYHASIGQGDILTTPLQVAHFTATIANGGTVIKPHLLKQIIDPHTNEIVNIFHTVQNENFIKKEHIQTVQEGMRDTIITGSARRLNSLPIAVAGKTGTAQWGYEKDPHAWFTSYAPYENPQIVLTILVEEGESGSEISADIAQEFYQFWAEYKGFVEKKFDN